MLTPDGKPYQLGQLSFYNPNDPQHALFNFWDEEAIRIGGSPIYYYEVFVPPGEIDHDFLEARGKLYSTSPVELYAIYEPVPSQNYLGVFGMDSMNEVVFECNAQAVIRATGGHLPKPDSRIYTPHLGENWRVIQCALGEFRAWGALRVNIIAKQWQGTVTTEEGRTTEKHPDIPKAL